MGGRLCQICASVANLKLAAEMITAGASDQAVASKIGGINRMTVSRHRRRPVEATRPRRSLEAANKGRSVVEDASRRWPQSRPATGGGSLGSRALSQT